MPLVCPSCGEYALKNILKSSNTLTCGKCAHQVAARFYPLFIVTGASGAGKTSVLPLLRERLPGLSVFDADLLWKKCADGEFLNNWLKIVYSQAQCGSPTVLCGTVLPWDLDAAENRDLVGATFYINLHCNDADRESRLRARPAFRNTTDAFIEEHRKFAQWLLENAETRFQPVMPIIDTSVLTTEEVADAVAGWIGTIMDLTCQRHKTSRAPGS